MSGTRLRVCIVAMALALGVRVAGVGQPISQDPEVTRYDGVVKAYQSGAFETAVGDRLAFDERREHGASAPAGADTARAWAKVSWRTAFEYEDKGVERRDIRALLLNAAALEIETARAELRAGRESKGFDDLMLAIALVDSPDWARKSEVVKPASLQARRAVRRLAYLLVAAIVHGEFELVTLARHVDRMLEVLPEDAEAHLAAGSLFETYTLPGVVSQLEPPVGSSMDPGLWRRQRVESGRRDALSHYRRAVAIDPALGEAQLRLGRMLSQRKEWDDAEKALHAARQSAPVQHTGYLAALFMGRVLEESGRRAEAIEAFRAAVETAPDAQSGRLALSAALRASGDASGADDAMAPLVTRRISSRMASDPWWLYRYGQSWRIEPWIATLREMVRG
jgi:tetratricopeptide (TPR) repeat protein